MQSPVPENNNKEEEKKQKKKERKKKQIKFRVTIFKTTEMHR